MLGFLPYVLSFQDCSGTGGGFDGGALIPPRAFGLVFVEIICESGSESSVISLRVSKFMSASLPSVGLPLFPFTVRHSDAVFYLLLLALDASPES